MNSRKSPKSSKSSSKSSSSSKRPITYKEYFSKLKNAFDMKSLKKINKKCICDNNESIITRETYEKNGEYVPLIYDSIWICFPFEEIFFDLYDLMKKEKLIYIPNPLNYNQNMSDQNLNIVLEIDNNFYDNKISKLLEKNMKSINIFDFLSKDDIYFLIEQYNRTKINPRDDLPVNLFIHWYNEIDRQELKLSVYKFNVKSYEKSGVIDFGVLLDKYIKNPLGDCSKDIKLALKNFLEYIYKKTNTSLNELDTIGEEDEENVI
jgi:hypothetical protein